jgi:uncharacterized protein (TIGR00369 family)
MHTDGKTVHVHFTPQPEHVGFRQVTHGGILATVLDEIMVWACAVQTRRFAFCAELNVRFLKSVPPGQQLHGTAELVENKRGRILMAKAELRGENGEVFVTSTGKYMPIKTDIPEEMLADMVIEPGTFSLRSE